MNMRKTNPPAYGPSPAPAYGPAPAPAGAKPLLALFFLFLSFFSLPALAADYVVGAAKPWDINFLEAFSPVKHIIHDFHFELLVILTGIVLIVLGLLIYVCVRYNAKAHPVPRKFSHNVTVEVVWTALPVLILFIIGVPSFKLLYFADKNPEAAFTIKATGYQWYWGYEYPDHGGFGFKSYMLTDEDLKNPQRMAELQAEWLIKDTKPLRLLETDTRIVIPVGVPVRIQTTAADVIHSWAMPSLGVKKDAVPGRLNETWVQADKPGVYFGQCSEICGTGHAFMPIALEAVPQEQFNAWIEAAKVKYAGSMPDFTRNLALAGE